VRTADCRRNQGRLPCVGARLCLCSLLLLASDFAQAKLSGTKGSITAGGALGQLDLSRQAFNYLSAARVQHVFMTKWDPEPVPSSMTDLLGTIKVNFEESWTSSASNDFQNLCRCSSDAESGPQMMRTRVYFLNNS
jgi:hypothetical protein